MAINYYDIFRQKIGQMNASTPMIEEDVIEFLDQAAYKFSRNYATPWSTFSDVSDQDKYGVVIVGALEYWWAKLGEDATKADFNTGSQFTNDSGTLFSRTLQMIDKLEKEYDEEVRESIEGSGDILEGDLVIRDKSTGNLVPYSSDPDGDWTANGE